MADNIFSTHLWTSWDEAGLVVLSAALMLASVVAVIRVTGLRSLSKMSSFDFAVTVAIGSILAGTVSTSTPYLHGLLAVGSLLGLQAGIARLRRRSRPIEHAIDNTPMLLMSNGEMIDAALTRCRVTHSDVIAKLREANAIHLDAVHAVVLETTGDISVLHGDGPFDDLLLDGVRDLRVG